VSNRGCATRFDRADPTTKSLLTSNIEEEKKEGGEGHHEYTGKRGIKERAICAQRKIDTEKVKARRRGMVVQRKKGTTSTKVSQRHPSLQEGGDSCEERGGAQARGKGPRGRGKKMGWRGE